jgi:hypothetical protein
LIGSCLIVGDWLPGSVVGGVFIKSLKSVLHCKQCGDKVH